MAKYINCDAFLEHMKRTNIYFDVKFEIENFPAADVAPVAHSRWNETGGLLECQNCGEIYCVLGGNEGKAWNYCPDCGARMDGDEP